MELTAALAGDTADAWERRLIGAGVPAARLRILPEALALPQVAARGFLQDPGTGAPSVPGLPFRLGDGPRFAPVGPVERLGESNGLLASGSEPLVKAAVQRPA